jgi:hypothetical protein
MRALWLLVLGAALPLLASGFARPRGGVRQWLLGSPNYGLKQTIKKSLKLPPLVPESAQDALVGSALGAFTAIAPRELKALTVKGSATRDKLSNAIADAVSVPGLSAAQERSIASFILEVLSSHAWRPFVKRDSDSASRHLFRNAENEVARQHA